MHRAKNSGRRADDSKFRNMAEKQRASLLNSSGEEWRKEIIENFDGRLEKSIEIEIDASLLASLILASEAFNQAAFADKNYVESLKNDENIDESLLMKRAYKLAGEREKLEMKYDEIFEE